MDLPKIEPGIYKHFKGNLYFVLGVAISIVDSTNQNSAEVIYHPLYLCENMNWWRRPLADFLESIHRQFPSKEIAEVYSGPRFVKIKNWALPNIIPGYSFNYRVHKCVIESLYLDGDSQDIKVLIKRRVLGANWESGIVESIQWLESRLESK